MVTQAALFTFLTRMLVPVAGVRPRRLGIHDPIVLFELFQQREKDLDALQRNVQHLVRLRR